MLSLSSRNFRPDAPDIILTALSRVRHVPALALPLALAVAAAVPVQVEALWVALWAHGSHWRGEWRRRRGFYVHKPALRTVSCEMKVVIHFRLWQVIMNGFWSRTGELNYTCMIGNKNITYVQKNCWYLLVLYLRCPSRLLNSVGAGFQAGNLGLYMPNMVSIGP